METVTRPLLGRRIQRVSRANSRASTGVRSDLRSLQGGYHPVQLVKRSNHLTNITPFTESVDLNIF